MRGSFSTWLKSLAIVAGSFIGATSAHAGFSGLGKHPVAEAVQEGIFSHQYGGAWHKVGDDFYNGTMSAKRMDDFLSTPSVLNIAKGECGDSTDQTWCGDKFKVSAVAKFSGNAQVLGTDVNGSQHNLLDVKGYGFDIDPASTTIDMHGKEFSWTRDGGPSGMQSSLNSMNADGRDHLITYVIEGLPGVKGAVWMMFFEDMDKLANTPKNRTFADYNDLVVEVRSVVSAVPLPPAVWTGLTTLSGAALIRGRKLISKALMA